MNKEELLDFINTTAKVKGDEEFSNLVFSKYYLFLTSDFVSNINDTEIFKYVTEHPKFHVSYIINMIGYLHSFIYLFESKIGNSNLSFLNNQYEVLDYFFNNIKRNDTSKLALIEFIYDCFFKELFYPLEYLVTYHKEKIDINYPTRYGFPLIWELFNFYLMSIKSDKNKSIHIFYMINKIIKNEFPDLDINNTGIKKFDIFHYLFNFKAGLTLSSDMPENNLTVILEFFISYPDFYFINNTSENKEPEKLFFDLLRNNSGFYGQSRYKELLPLLVNNIYLDVNYKIDNLPYTIFELLLERTYFNNESPVDLLYQKLIYTFIEKYKNKFTVSKIFISDALSNKYLSLDIKMKKKKIYDDLKNNVIKNLNTLLDSIDEGSSLNEEEEELDNIDYCTDYYGTEGAREVSHRFKNNDPNAIKVMARMMAKCINSDDSLIPIPSRNGVATNTLELVNAISELTGARVSNILKGKPRESIYYIKKRGEDVTSIDFGYKLTDKIPSNPVLIDGVYATGTTMRNVLNIIPNARIVVFAKTIKSNLD